MWGLLPRDEAIWGVAINLHRQIRIRLFGNLDVVRADGTGVSPQEWRTGKTMDLLRTLALNNGRPVRQSLLLERLWPEVEEGKQRGSLRTASSQIRSVLQHNCVIREAGSLVLRDAWVDVTRFREDARLVHAAALAGQHSRVLALTLAAERLYRDDFRAHDDDSPWARGERDLLCQLRHETLCDAAAAALHLGRPRDALDHAWTAVRLDRSSERAHRAMMQAYAEVGEIGNALRTFESYRAHLAEELGADPSPQTRELHLSLLRGQAQTGSPDREP